MTDLIPNLAFILSLYASYRSFRLGMKLAETSK